VPRPRPRDRGSGSPGPASVFITAFDRRGLTARPLGRVGCVEFVEGRPGISAGIVGDVGARRLRFAFGVHDGARRGARHFVGRRRHLSTFGVAPRPGCVKELSIAAAHERASRVRRVLWRNHPRSASPRPPSPLPKPLAVDPYGISGRRLRDHFHPRRGRRVIDLDEGARWLCGDGRLRDPRSASGEFHAQRNTKGSRDRP